MEDQTTKITKEKDSAVRKTVDEKQQENTASTSQKPELVMIDIRNKMAIVLKVLKACMEEKRKNNCYYKDDILNRFMYLTELPKDILDVIIYKTRGNDVLQESMPETPDIDMLIRRTLAKYYIKQNKIPKYEFLTHIVDNRYSLHQQLQSSGYIWRRLPNTRKAILVEHPKRILERQAYLQKLMTYRDKKRCLVYIETKIVSKAGKDIQNAQVSLTEEVNFVVMIIAVANNHKGLLNRKIFYSQSIFQCQKLIEDYIVKYVVPKLTEPSVIVLEDKSFYRKSLPVPTIESEKSEMIRWLEINGLSHEKTTHRSELFDLIQRCKNRSDLHTFDTILRSQGHNILRRPIRTDYLNYYKPLWDNFSSFEEITIFITNKNLDYWKNLEITLIQNEMSKFKEDLEMENITDKIFTMANNTNVSIWADVECDEEVDSLVQEEFLIEIKNSLPPEVMQTREEQLIVLD